MGVGVGTGWEPWVAGVHFIRNLSSTMHKLLAACGTICGSFLSSDVTKLSPNIAESMHLYCIVEDKT